MKIDSNFINQIFNLEIRLRKKEDKLKLSQYEEQIPMYDIYSQRIYPINRHNIHYRLIESHYRFVNSEVLLWIGNLYEKYSLDPIIGPKLKYNLELMDNYLIEVLIETSYKTLYKYSPQLGLLVSICKRNSFHPFIYHLKPYYTKLELIKLGQNMNIIKDSIDPEYLIDQDIHYNICKTVSNNDVSFDEIKAHHEYILSANITPWICFYSWTGSFLFNRYLRNLNTLTMRTNNVTSNRQNRSNSVQLNPVFYNGLLSIVQAMKNSPGLNNPYDIYRFLWDDSFLLNLKIGDEFIDKGFTSTTRDPFYSPGLQGAFGLLLVKIKIPQNKKGLGLFIENFSLFPREEEFLLPPYAKLKLISKNENFKYYHTNPEFEKLINRKYEFELVGIDYNLFFKENLQLTKLLKQTYTPIETINIMGIDRIDMIKKFIGSFGTNENQINLSINKTRKFTFIYQWFDSTNTSSYEKFYWNKIKDGIMLTLFEPSGYPWLTIEFGTTLAVNYLNQQYFGKSNNIIDQTILDLIYHFGRIFYYKDALIFHKCSFFDDFATNYNKSTQVFLSMGMYNKTIYNYLKKGEQFIPMSFVNYSIGYWYLDEYFNKPIDLDVRDKLPEPLKKLRTNKELFIECVETQFNYYPKLIEQLDPTIFANQMVKFNVYEKLVAEGLADNFKPNVEYTSDDIPDSTYKLIFRQPIRRL
jgi:hypothetical protein